MKKIKLAIKEYITAFFYSRGKPQPIYFWATVLLSLVVVMIVLSIINRLPIEKEVFITIIGLVLALIGLYNFRKTDDGGDNG